MYKKRNINPSYLKAKIFLFFGVLFISSISTASECKYDYSTEEIETLIYHSDINVSGDVPEMLGHIVEIEKIMTEKKDRRGIFTVFIRNVIETSLEVSEDDFYNDHHWINELSLTFTRIYLDNLNKHLKNEEVTPSWQHFYDLAANCSRPVGRIATAGINAHLVVDFPEAIYAAESQFVNVFDYFKYGDVVVHSLDRILLDIEATYDADLSRLFGFYFLGDSIDEQLGEGASSALGFQGVRAVAWRNGMDLRSDYVSNDVVRFNINLLWRSSELAFDALELMDGFE